MIGHTVSHYRITKKPGKSGVGVVHKAEDARFLHTVALKFLASEPILNREAKATSSLQHNNIYSTRYIDKTTDSHFFTVMATYKSETLTEEIGGRLLNLGKTVHIAIQIAERLVRAHEECIVCILASGCSFVCFIIILCE
ncbi:MAG: hypothetical protein P8184_17050 [Calditrichia bacterium]